MQRTRNPNTAAFRHGSRGVPHDHKRPSESRAVENRDPVATLTTRTLTAKRIAAGVMRDTMSEQPSWPLLQRRNQPPQAHTNPRHTHNIKYLP